MSSPDGPFGLTALWRAYRACRKGKRKARDTQRYESRLLDRLVSTRDALASLRWRPSPALSFVVRRPKLREIHAARFGDRVSTTCWCSVWSGSGSRCSSTTPLSTGAARQRLRAQVASFRAHCRHASAAGVWERTLARFPWLRGMFDRPEEGSLAEPLRPGWNAASVSGLAGQYRALARRHPDAGLLLETGNRWLWSETAGPSGWPEDFGRRVLRPGLGPCREIAASGLADFCRRLRRSGQAYVLAAQTGHFRTGFRRREIIEFWYPPVAAAAQAFFSATDRGER